ncbi:LINE-1 retrotransposable element ORF1 protein [Plecturocebus cupreus]
MRMQIPCNSGEGVGKIRQEEDTNKSTSRKENETLIEFTCSWVHQTSPLHIQHGPGFQNNLLRIGQAEERITGLADQFSELTPSDNNQEKAIKKNEQNLYRIWDYVKTPNLQLTDILEREGKKAGKLENIFEDIIHENFSNLAREANFQI